MNSLSEFLIGKVSNRKISKGGTAAAAERRATTKTSHLLCLKLLPLKSSLTLFLSNFI